MLLSHFLFVSILVLPSLTQSDQSRFVFLKANNETNSYTIGNDIWNVKINKWGFGKQLWYKGQDLVGNASGHYVSYNGAANNVTWDFSPPKIVRYPAGYSDIVFYAREGDLHWVLRDGMAGAYQYFVNRALPVLGEFRTLWRLDNATFTHGWTVERNEPLVPLFDIRGSNAKKVQDETWQRENGSFITKYDLATFLNVIEGEPSIWGVQGKLKTKAGSEGIGSWYIHGGKDYLNGNHQKQELMVHRESITGDVVQLNMIHGTHFQASSRDKLQQGRIWGPWLWYINNGSAEDALIRAKEEVLQWPYSWFTDSGDDAYSKLRGSIKGRIVMSDGRPATGAAVFWGDNRSPKTPLDQGEGYYYRTYAKADGSFEISNMRVLNNPRSGASLGTIQAWPNGGNISDVTTVLKLNDVELKPGTTDLGIITWKTQHRRYPRIWQVGEIDRTAKGFGMSGPPHEHARSTKCPPDLVFTIGINQTSDWCFSQVHPGTWSIQFSLPAPLMQSSAAILSIALAAYTSGVSSMILLNGQYVGDLNSTTVGGGDPALYRSGTLAGEWHLVQVPIHQGLLKEGQNVLALRIRGKRFTPGWSSSDAKIGEVMRWRGFMFDSILLEWDY